MKEYKNKKEFKLDLINLSPVEVYEEVLSGRYIKRFPSHYWEKPESLINAKIIMKYFIKNKLNIKDIRDLPNKISFDVIKKYKLYGMVTRVFKYKLYDAINNAYPNKFKEWEFKGITVWTKDNSKEALKWVIEEKLEIKIDCEENRIKFLKMYNYNLLSEYNLLGALNAVSDFDYSPYKLLENVYPGKFKPWELNMVPNKYWNDETIKDSIKWLIEEKLRLKYDDYNEMLSINIDVFKKYGLGTVIHTYFADSIFKALDFVYPNRFKYNDFKSVINNKIRNIKLKNNEEK